MEKYRILTGNAIEVEADINKLDKDYWTTIVGFSSTNETTTVIVEIMDR